MTQKRTEFLVGKMHNADSVFINRFLNAFGGKITSGIEVVFKEQNKSYVNSAQT